MTICSVNPIRNEAAQTAKHINEKFNLLSCPNISYALDCINIHGQVKGLLPI
jgi:hypothetical protein